MRINVDNAVHPGVSAETTLTLGSELARSDIFRNDTYVGQVVYVARRTATGTVYGHRPAKAAPQSRLTTMNDAVALLLRGRT